MIPTSPFTFPSSSLLFPIALLLLAVTEAQVQNHGRFDSLVRQIYLGKRSSTSDLSQIRVRMPFHDTRALQAGDQPTKSATGPLKFAQAIDANLDSRRHGLWETDTFNGLRIWSLLVESQTAKTLSLVFDHFRLPAEGELYVMNDDTMLGAFTAAANNKPDGKFAIQPVHGEQLFVVYLEPLLASVSTTNATLLDYLKIKYVVHGYRDIFRAQLREEDDKDLSGSCNLDTRCVTQWEDQKRSVVVFMTDQMQKFCTAVMVNNARNDGRQLMLTANHCVFTDLSNSVAGFNYERLGCGGGAIRSPQSAHGMRLLARWGSSDFAIFEVQERIPTTYNVYLSGWDARTNVLASNVAGIHHPSGDVKKISLFGGQLGRGAWSEGSARQYHWVVSRWTRGVTEPGSSGSPLFNSAGQVIGQLHGGSSACNNLQGADLYGGLAFSFDAAESSANQLRPILVPNGASVRVLSGRNLAGPAPPTTTIVSPPTSTRPTSTSVSCPACVPRDLVDQMLAKAEAEAEARVRRARVENGCRGEKGHHGRRMTVATRHSHSHSHSSTDSTDSSSSSDSE